MKGNKHYFVKGIHDGMPIALGYFAVAITLGLAAKKCGISVFQSGLLSFTNCTSAGEFAGLDAISMKVTYIETAFIMVVINIRYLLMSCSLSQRVDENTSLLKRALLAFCITDEIFGIMSSIEEDKVSPYYGFGAISVALPAWTLGTCIGVALGNILPLRVLSALSIALYGMFIAVVVPKAKRDKAVAAAVAASMFFSTVCSYIPYVKDISSGVRIAILTVIISLAAAIIHPVDEVDSETAADMEQNKEGNGAVHGV